MAPPFPSMQGKHVGSGIEAKIALMSMACSCLVAASSPVILLSVRTASILLGSYIFEQSCPRINEAALVHETDQELDCHLARSRGEVTEFDRVQLSDYVLQRTVDMPLAMAHIEAEEEG
jgi:hypothetical protein